MRPVGVSWPSRPHAGIPAVLQAPRRPPARPRRRQGLALSAAHGGGAAWPSPPRPPGDPLALPAADAATSAGSFAAALLSGAAAACGDALRALRRRARRGAAALEEPEARLVLEGCQLLACLLFVLLYVWSTYSPVVPGEPRWWLDMGLCLVFAADWAQRLVTSSAHPLLAALHPLALVDLLSFAPSLLAAAAPAGLQLAAPWGLLDLRWFRVFRALRLLRLSLLAGNLSAMKTNRHAARTRSAAAPPTRAGDGRAAPSGRPPRRRRPHRRPPPPGRGALIAGNLNVPLVWLVASVVAWLFTSASCVAVMEKWAWHDAFYFVTSTITTVGYGDVVVKSSLGRLFVLVMMMAGVVLIPVRASQLYSRLSGRLSSAGHAPGRAPGSREYVVLSGRLSDVRGFNDFLQDFLVQVRGRPSGGRGGLQLVCLCNKPSVEFLALQELHEAHLTLVEGSAFSEEDLLTRAKLAGSTGAMVLADRFSSNAAAEDTDVQFRVWAIKAAVKRVPLYVQVLRAASVSVIAPFLDPNQDVISSVEGTRLRLLALNSLCPGASTLLANLLRCSGPNAGAAGGPRHAARPGARGGGAGAAGSPTGSRDDAGRAGARGGGETMAGRRWLREYADGAHCELFFAPAGPALAGLRFSSAAEAAYDASGALLVGVVQTRSQRLLLNPGSYRIKQGQTVAVLATTQAVAEAGAAGEGLELRSLSCALAAAAATAALATGAGDDAAQPQRAAARGASTVRVRVPGLLAEELLQVGPEGRGGGKRRQQVQVRLSSDRGAWEQQHQGQQQQAQQQGQEQLELQAALERRGYQGLRLQQQAQQVQQAAPQAQQAAPQAQQAQQAQQARPAAPRAQQWQQQPPAPAPPRPFVLRDVISQPGSASFGPAGSPRSAEFDEADADADETLAALNPCLTNWMGSFESDSMDETEICTDSELLEAALLQRKRQEQREARAAGGGAGQPGTPAAAAQRLLGDAQQEAGDGGGGALEPRAAAGAGDAGGPSGPQAAAAPPLLGGPVPRQLSGHFILAGCASSFVGFAEQLHAMAPMPPALVILHPEPPPREVFEALSALGPTYYVRGQPSSGGALAAAAAAAARSLVVLGASERPTHLASLSVSGVYGDPTSREPGASSRTAVLADADALRSCYGVGEVLLPDALHTVVELGFTSSIRFLQPGLLLHGRAPPHSAGSYDEPPLRGGARAAVGRLVGGLAALVGGGDARRRAPRDADEARDREPGGAAAGPPGSRSSSPQQPRRRPPPPAAAPPPAPPPRQPRSSWRHRKEIEDAGRAEGLTEWQLNSYYAAGRVMVPALLDTFTCQGFFKRRALQDLMTELAGDDGRPGGAMLRQLPVPPHLVGCTYRELVAALLSAPAPQDRHVALGLLRRKAENRAWRLPFVATHPDPDTVLQITDAVFVIRPQ
ncbi:Kcnt2 [Scenedesmus sp. PABB004]|nr:Kcnt2 [Scenedesmus sp. PABB004]